MYYEKKCDTTYSTRDTYMIIQGKKILCEDVRYLSYYFYYIMLK